MPAAPVPGRACPSRRTVVGAVLVLPVASTSGCTLSGPKPTRTRAEAPPEDPDVALLERVTASTAALVDLYAAVLRRHRGLREQLAPLLDARRAHADALGQAAPAGRAGTGSRPQDRRRRARVDVPARARPALRRLVEEERQAAAQLLGATRRAASGGFAQLLASMSASSAQAVQVLGQVIAPDGGR